MPRLPAMYIAAGPLEWVEDPTKTHPLRDVKEVAFPREADL